MRFVIQRVQHAECVVDGRTTGAIGRGFLVLIGVTEGDDKATADRLMKKLLGLRIFEDAEGKTNLSLSDVEGELLLISQFTLYADCRKGNRPSFTDAARPETAEPLYEYILAECGRQLPEGRVQRGIFGADMKISLLNDGPFTVILDSEELQRPKRS